MGRHLTHLFLVDGWNVLIQIRLEIRLSNLHIQLLGVHYNVQTRFCIQVSFSKFLFKLISTTWISGYKLSILYSLLVM